MQLFLRMNGTSLLLLLTLSPAAAVPLKSADGLAIELSPAGRVTAIRAGATALPLKGDGGFSLADFQNQAEPVNLVPNPGFEEGTKGWALEAGQALDAAVFHSGRASVRLEIPGPAPARSNLQVILPAKPLTHYRVGMWMRRHNAPSRPGGAPGAYSSELDEKGEHVGVYQMGGTVPQQDDVWSPVTWDVVTRADTRQLLLRGDLYQTTGTIWLDDFFIHEVKEAFYRPVSGGLSPSKEGHIFRGSLPEAGLELDATFRPDRECLRVDGVVRDTTGRDRAVGVRFGLPLDLAGYIWHDDAEDRAPIEAGRTYRNTYDCESGTGRCSVYPWSAISGKGAGLSLALPLSQGPRVFVLQHDGRAPEYSLTFFFGLAKDAARNPGRAPFSFVLYRHDPRWGMRSAMERYYRLFAESFTKRPAYEGYLNYANLERFLPETHEIALGSIRLPDASDFGEGYRFLWHMHGCYDYRQVASDDAKMPTDETVFTWLRALTEDEKGKPRYYTPTEETMRKIVFNSQGLIRYIFDTQYWRAKEGYNGTDKPGWGLNFRVNEDPGLSDYVARKTRAELEKGAAAPGRRPWDACLTADAIDGYGSNERGLDYRREHFRTTTFPLTFGSQSLKPAICNTIWDLHNQVWRPLTQEHQVVTYGNGNVVSGMFTMPYVDICMVEGRWGRARLPQEERFWRASAHHKIWRFWCEDTNWYHRGADRASVMRHLRHGLASATFPALSAAQSATGDMEPFRAAYRQYVPAMEALSAAGWEPVPHATATGGAIVERFGSFAEGNLHFTLRHYATDRSDPTDPSAATLTLDRKGLGIPQSAPLFAADLLPGTPALEPLGGGAGARPAAAALPGEPALTFSLEADGSRAFWIGTREQAAARGFRLAAVALEKIDRLFAAELDGAGRQMLSAGLALARAPHADARKALADAEQLQALAGRLQAGVKSAAPVDLAKLLFRLRVAAAHVPVALLGLSTGAPRVVENGLRGEDARPEWRLERPAGRRFTDLRAEVLSPWPETAGRAALDAGIGATVRARLPLPAEPARALLPYLLVVHERADGIPYTVATPVDVVLSESVEVALEPRKLARGEQTTVTLTATNRLSEAAGVRVRFQAPAGITVAPAEIALQVPARATAQASVALDVGRNVMLGLHRLAYTVAGDKPRFASSGAVMVDVTVPGK